MLDVKGLLSDIDESKRLGNRIKNFSVIVSLDEIGGEIIPVFNCSEPICMTEDAYEAFSEAVLQASMVASSMSGEPVSIEDVSHIASVAMRKLMAQDEVFFPDEELLGEIHEVSDFENIMLVEDTAVIEVVPNEKD